MRAHRTIWSALILVQAKMATSKPDSVSGSAASVRSAALSVLLPLLAASAITWLEPMLGRLARDRPGIVPVAVMAIVVGLISPNSRRWLVSTLCFGVSLLALRDVIRALHLPSNLPLGFRESFYIRAYVCGWIVLAGLAAASAVGEALQPGAVWARRCYFLAAAVYFAGHGVLSFLKEPTWQSPVLVVIGIVALVGAWMADRMVDPEPEQEPLDDDLQAIVNRSSERAANLSRREWVEKR